MKSITGLLNFMSNVLNYISWITFTPDYTAWEGYLNLE
jgi:hypothetical protein